MKLGPTVGGARLAQLRLLPPPQKEHALRLGLAVGDVVVYASHGIGRVEARRPGGGGLPETVALVFESGLRVILPVARALDALRPLPAAGQATALAEVVRDGLQRERRLAARASGRTTGPSDRQLYVRARTLLTAEIALCRGIELAEADAWILDQVAGQPPT